MLVGGDSEPAHDQAIRRGIKKRVGDQHDQASRVPDLCACAHGDRLLALSESIWTADQHVVDELSGAQHELDRAPPRMPLGARVVQYAEHSAGLVWRPEKAGGHDHLRIGERILGREAHLDPNTLTVADFDHAVDREAARSDPLERAQASVGEVGELPPQPIGVPLIPRPKEIIPSAHAGPSGASDGPAPAV